MGGVTQSWKPKRYSSPSCKSEDLRARLQRLRILIVTPDLRSKEDQHRQKNRQLGGWAAGPGPGSYVGLLFLGLRAQKQSTRTMSARNSGLKADPWRHGDTGSLLSAGVWGLVGGFGSGWVDGRIMPGHDYRVTRCLVNTRCTDFRRFVSRSVKWGW